MPAPLLKNEDFILERKLSDVENSIKPGGGVHGLVVRLSALIRWSIRMVGSSLRMEKMIRVE